MCVTGCGDDDSSTGDTGSADVGMDTAPDTSTGARVICEGSVAYDEKCGDDPIEPIEECEEELGCVPYREDLKALIAECIEERDCGTSDDICFTRMGIEFTPSAAAEAFFTACESRRRECSDAFGADWCFVEIATDEAIGMLDTCLDEPCGAIQRCFIPVVTCR